MLRDCNLLDYLTLILHLPFKNQNLKMGDFQNANVELLKILQLCYKVIKATIKEYRPNEIYMS
jgi:hypothetical protein